MITAKVDAAKALEGLKALGEELRVKAVVAGLQKPGRVLRSAMQDMAPRASGILQQSIQSRQLSKSAGERLDVFTGAKGRAQVTIDPNAAAAVLVGPNKKVKGRTRAYVAVVLEGGAGSHTIRPRRKNAKQRLALAYNVVVKGGVTHPGVRPRPFMERALAVTGPQIEALFYQGLQAHLDKLKR